MLTTSPRTVLVVLVSGYLAATQVIAQEPPRFHTRSIVACDPLEDACGIAVVSFPSGVPAVVPVGEPGVVVANQSFPSFATAREIIDRVQSGDDAPTALATALALDPFPEERQLGVAALYPASPSGVSVASFTGANNFPETCSVLGDTYAVQANLQSSSAVCQAIADGFEAAQGSLARRLLAALSAGSPVGGDARGEFSASLRVFSSSWILAGVTPISADSGVNRAANWEQELTFGVNAFLATITPPNPSDAVELTRERAQEIQRILKDLGFYGGAVNGKWSDASEAALLDFGAFNLFFPSGTQELMGVRVINGPLSDYIVQGAPRGVLTPSP